MLSLQQIREKYPENAGLSDDKLVSKLYKAYGKGDEVGFYKQFDVKPPVQSGKIAGDILGAPKRAIGLGVDLVTQIPKGVGNILKASKHYDEQYHGKGIEGTARLAQNLAGGLIEGVTDLRHIPEQIGQYAENRGIIKENPAAHLFDKTDWGSFIKPEDENEFDKTFQSLGNFGGILKASHLLGKLLGPAAQLPKDAGKIEKALHVARQAKRDIAEYGTPFAVEATAHGEDPLAALLMPGLARTAFEGAKAAKLHYKAGREAVKETKRLENKVTDKEREVKRHTEGEDVLQGAEKQFKAQHEKAKTAFGKQLGQERGKVQETLETTGGYLEGERSATRAEAKENVVEAVKEEHAKITAEEAQNYKPFNKGGPAHSTVVPEEHQAPSRIPKSIEDTTTRPLLEKVGRKQDLWNAWEQESLKVGELDQKLNKMYGEMKRKGWDKVTDAERAKYEAGTKQYKEAKAREAALKKEWDKTKEPVAGDWLDVYREARDEAHHIGRQMQNDAITSQELKALKTKRDALKRVRDDAKNKIKKILSPEHYSKFEKANLHHQKYVAPFQKSPFLKNMIEGEGAASVANIHNKLSGEKARRLVERLYQNQKVKSKIVAHDLKTLNIEQPAAINEFLHEHAKGLDNKIKTQLQARAEALIKENGLAKLEAAMTKTEAKLLAESPQISKLIKNNPSLKKAFEQIGKEQKVIELVQEQMNKVGMSKDIQKRELNALKENMEDLRAERERWENAKKNMKRAAISSGGLAASYLGINKLFGG